MGEERKKAGFWPWVVALLIGLPVLYVASFGPACWYVMRTNIHLAQPIGRSRFGFDQPHPRFDAVYWPIGWCAGCEPIPGMRPVIVWYAKVGAPEGGELFLTSLPDANKAEGIGMKNMSSPVTW